MAADSVTVATKAASKIETSKQPVSVEPEQITRILQQLGRFHGAAEIGITRLEPYHYYSHAGRRAENWGEPISTDHIYAIVIMVPMNVDMIKKAPLLPEILESTSKYVETAKIAHIIANYIKYLGYDAKAHFDGNYQVACVPIANDAGLGEVGRLSILINPRYGPCVRLAVVTTDLELRETSSKNHHIEDFCDMCKKCADNCPSKSIPFEEKPAERGLPHWSIDMESCYSFWKKMGTDCGICIRVCPYTKPNTLIHKIVRFYITRNPLNQRIALFLDNLMYGLKIKFPTSNPEKSSMLA
jgi:reductive dehalogenase